MTPLDTHKIYYIQDSSKPLTSYRSKNDVQGHLGSFSRSNYFYSKSQLDQEKSN